jgi:hypothetical protein
MSTLSLEEEKHQLEENCYMLGKQEGIEGLWFGAEKRHASGSWSDDSLS